jgi:hypothetical protein
MGIALSLGTFCHFSQSTAQTTPRTSMKHILVIGETKGFEHDSIPDAMANIWKMGHDTKL